MGSKRTIQSAIMHAQRPYILPIKGLKIGLHTFNLVADEQFFATFLESPVAKANIQLLLTVDKRHSDMELHFEFSGSIQTDCDRCLAMVDFPVEGEEQLLVQFTSEPNPLSDDPNLVLLSYDEHELNVAPYAYEFFVLSLPMIKTFDCRDDEPPYPCDEEMLDRLSRLEEEQQQAPQPDASKPSPWDILKNLNKN